MGQHADDRDRLSADGTPVTSQQDYLQRLADIEAAVARAQPEPDLLVERAAGLIAGRAGCRVDEAQVQLRLLAREQGRQPSEVAADILTILHTSLSARRSDVRDPRATSRSINCRMAVFPYRGEAPLAPAQCGSR